jgi:hypothetical protein|tara:strand:- start:33 stop:572 length:540 start_codon:yes stop_codon:yes gene_type:complete
MSKLETNTIDTVSGTTNLTIGSTNSSTVTFENGAVTGHMYPAFHVNINGQTISIANGTVTKVILTNEIVDTDNAYDTSTGKFTPQVAGKYFVYGAITYDKTGDFDDLQIRLRKNNSSSISEALDRNHDYTTINAYGIVDLNGSTDYIEIYTKQSAGGASDLINNQDGSRNYFGAYRIGA